MKKLVLALSAVAAFTGSAIAADLPARTYTKAPAPVAYAPSWTGCYVGGGGGYGMWNQENTFVAITPIGNIPEFGQGETNGGRGYFGTVQAGCDYQFPVGANNFVIGAFGDYDFASLKGNLGIADTPLFGQEKMTSAWAVGGRIGWLVTPGFLTYFSGGYTQATFGSVDFFEFGVPSGISLLKQTYGGYFLGAGDEYALSFMPGLFWKTEYRYSSFNTKTNEFFEFGFPSGEGFESRKYVQSVRSELVYHFNWGGPVVAKY